MPKKLKPKPKKPITRTVIKKKMIVFPGEETAETAMLREAISKFIQPNLTAEIRAIMQTLMLTTQTMQRLKTNLQNEDRMLKDLYKDIQKLASSKHVSYGTDQVMKYSQYFIDTFDIYEENLIASHDEKQVMKTSNKKDEQLSPEVKMNEPEEESSLDLDFESSIEFSQEPSIMDESPKDIEAIIQEAIAKYITSEATEDYHKTDDINAIEQKITNLMATLEAQSQANADLSQQNRILKDSLTTMRTDIKTMAKEKEQLQQDMKMKNQTIVDLDMYIKQFETKFDHRMTELQMDEHTQANARAAFAQMMDLKLKSFQMELETTKNRIGGKQEEVYA